MQEKTSDPHVPQMIGYLGKWVDNQRNMRNQGKLNKTREDEVD